MSDNSTSNSGPHRHAGFWGLTLASVGVVFGDIGTSPLYAMREALHHARGAESEATVLGVVSLIFWALMLIVTLKYVTIMLRAHNNGEGGTLALMALAQRVTKRGRPSPSSWESAARRCSMETA